MSGKSKERLNQDLLEQPIEIKYKASKVKFDAFLDRM